MHIPVHRAVAQLPLARALREVAQVAPHLVLLPAGGAAVAAGQQRGRRRDSGRVLLVVRVGAASHSRLELGPRRLGGLPLDLLVPRAVRRPHVKGLRKSRNLFSARLREFSSHPFSSNVILALDEDALEHGGGSRPLGVEDVVSGDPEAHPFPAVDAS